MKEKSLAKTKAESQGSQQLADLSLMTLSEQVEECVRLHQGITEDFDIIVNDFREVAKERDSADQSKNKLVSPNLVTNDRVDELVRLHQEFTKKSNIIVNHFRKVAKERDSVDQSKKKLISPNKVTNDCVEELVRLHQELVRLQLVRLHQELVQLHQEFTKKFNIIVNHLREKERDSVDQSKKKLISPNLVTNDCAEGSPVSSSASTPTASDSDEDDQESSRQAQMREKHLDRKIEIYDLIEKYHPLKKRGTAVEWNIWLTRHECRFERWFGNEYSDAAWEVMNEVPDDYLPKYTDQNNRCQCKDELLKSLRQWENTEWIEEMTHLKLSQAPEAERLKTYIKKLFRHFRLGECDQLLELLENAFDESGIDDLLPTYEIEKLIDKAKRRIYYLDDEYLPTLELVSMRTIERDLLNLIDKIYVERQRILTQC